MCLYPRLIKNRKFVANKKNGGIVPLVNDKRTLLVPVGCGKCIECRKQKSRAWQVRLNEEIRESKNGKFVTLTFNNESIKKLSSEIKGLSGYDLDNEIATLAVRRFLERWRKKFGKSIRHWLITELGHNGTENLHLHGLLFTNESDETINEKWGYGFTWIGSKKNKGYVNEKTINYITKYVTKIDEKHSEYMPKILCSKGIGKGYINRVDSKNNKFVPRETNETYKTRQGMKLNLPIYYRNKIYTEEEREQLWIEKLDKNERWITGKKINLNKKGGQELYDKMLKEAQKRNKYLGYGDNSKNWDLKKYQNEQRNLKLLERIKNKKQPKKDFIEIKTEYNNFEIKPKNPNEAF